MPKVLLIEDDVTMLSLLKTLLEIEGFQVEVSNGNGKEQILNTIHQKMPGLILLDYHLEAGSSLDILRQIRADEQLKATQIIMTSGMDVRDQCIQAGADGFLLKPYMPDELVQFIRNRLSA